MLFQYLNVTALLNFLESYFIHISVNEAGWCIDTLNLCSVLILLFDLRVLVVSVSLSRQSTGFSNSRKSSPFKSSLLSIYAHLISFSAIQFK